MRYTLIVDNSDETSCVWDSETQGKTYWSALELTPKAPFYIINEGLYPSPNSITMDLLSEFAMYEFDDISGLRESNPELFV